MNWKKLNKIKTSKAETKFGLVIVFLFLICLALFSAINFITVLELRNQVNLILFDISKTKIVKRIVVASSTTAFLPLSEGVSTSTIAEVSSSTNEVVAVSKQEAIVFTVETETNLPTYSNTFSEPFFSAYDVDTANTNLVLDESITAMTFKPLFELKYEKSCSNDNCGLEPNSVDISSKIKIPEELVGKEIKNTSYSKLERKWVIGFVVADGNEEIGYVYLFDGNTLTPLITNNTNHKIVTRYGYGGGSISAGGSDNQFIILYSGYEGVAYLYNNGAWQGISEYFGLRVVSGGFKAKIIKGGNGNLATWYVCSDDGVKSKLIKLWQNNTASVQGAIDLSSVLTNQPVKCFYKNSREVNLIINNSLHVFKDNGFDNSHNYYYQSNNINSYFGKKVIKIYFLSTSVNAASNAYSFLVSADKKSWVNVTDKEANIDNKNLDTVYLKAKFLTGNSEYSPWFGGLENIFYVAQDRQ